jgi:hypothetical protein
MNKKMIVKLVLFLVLFSGISLAQNFIIQDSTSGIIDIGENFLISLTFPEMESTEASILTYDELRDEYVDFIKDGVVFSFSINKGTIALPLSVIATLTGKIKLKFNQDDTEKTGSYNLRLK